MIIDARTLPAGRPVDCDICIVGAGPAGITLALELAQSNYRVYLLDAGGLSYTRRTQQLLTGDVVGGPYPALHETRLAALGGASSVWAGWCRPLDSIDFERREEINYSGWPFAREALLPFYHRAQELCGLGPFDYDVARWEARTGLQRLSLPRQDLDAAMFQVRVLNFGRVYQDTLQRSANIQTLLHATALRLYTAPDSERIERLRVGTLSGRQFDVRARRFVLAAGGIENARLLLLSGDSPERSIGNAHDLVGRYFMEHGFINAGTYVSSDPQRSLAFHFPSQALDAQFPWSVRCVFSLTEATLRREGLRACAIFFHPQYEAHPVFDAPAVQAMLEIGNKLRGRAVPGGYGKRIVKALTAPQKLAIAATRKFWVKGGPQPRWRTRALFECAPERHNRVTLSKARDAFGRPLARLHWRASDADMASVIKAHGLFDAALRKSGLGHFEARWEDAAEWRTAVEAGKHHMGSTRMHPDPRQGVVDADGKVHGIANLYITGSSVFPTGGYANPTLTLVALAVRLADHLKRQAP